MSKQFKKIEVEQKIISITNYNENDYICLADMIRDGISKQERFNKLYKIAQYQKEILDKQDFLKSIKKTADDVYLDSNNPNELSEQ
jgi:hypothetical protein